MGDGGPSSPYSYANWGLTEGGCAAGTGALGTGREFYTGARPAELASRFINAVRALAESFRPPAPSVNREQEGRSAGLKEVNVARYTRTGV